MRLTPEQRVLSIASYAVAAAAGVGLASVACGPGVWRAGWQVFCLASAAMGLAYSLTRDRSD